MKGSLRFFGLFCFGTLMAICGQANAAPPSTISGEAIQLELSKATLTISYETINTDGVTDTVILYEGPYQEEFAPVEQITEPTEVTISLQLTEYSNPMTIKTLMGTGSDIHFAYIDHPGSRDEFLLVGVSNQVMNPKNKFSISGDLSFLDLNTTTSTSVELRGTVYDEDGNRRGMLWGPVLLKDNSFLIEGDVAKPTSATLFVRGDQNTYAQVILEPQSEFVVAKLGNQTHEISITGGLKYHDTLVENWQQQGEYIELIEAFATEYQQFVQRQESGQPEPIESDADKTTDSEDGAEVVKRAEGCEEVIVQKHETSPSPAPTPKYFSLQLKTMDFRNGILREIAEGNADSWVRYLAFEMQPYAWDDFERKLAALRSLAKEFDDKFVAEFITPKIANNENMSIVVQNDAMLTPGQKVPDFTLTSFEGKEVGLYDLLVENDMVLLDFWAVWCGPCIAAFPKLKTLHEAYSDQNFEIVSVSIDSKMEDWKRGAEQHQLPWVNLGEAKGWDGPVSTMYGITALPKGFLVDSQGCIYRKNIQPSALKEFLADRYGMDESPEKPEEAEVESDASG